jgi:hypothetical protein
VAAGEGNDIGKFVGEVWDRCKGGWEGKNCKCATSGCVPVNTDVSLGEDQRSAGNGVEMKSDHRRGRNEIGVPCTTRNLHVVVSVLFLCCLSEDMAVGDAIRESVCCNLCLGVCSPILGCTNKSRHRPRL